MRGNLVCTVLYPVLFGLLVQGCAEQHIGAQIRARYEAELADLPLSRQQHFALRMYRISGDQRYLPPIRRDALRDLEDLRRDLANLQDPAYRQERARGIVERYRDDTRKYLVRKQLLARAGELPFAKGLLYDVYRARQLGLTGPPPRLDAAPALAWLRTVDWAGFWLAPDTLKIYTAQSVNQIYYLYHLGIADLRQQLEQAFRQVFPDARDAELSDLEYENKLYGLAHFIIAASRYYQQFIDRDRFAWILRYFDEHSERILAAAREDILAEVVLCYLLAGDRDHAVVRRSKQALEAAYDPEARMIPAPDGSTDLEYGEHRNTLAIMIYYWPETLHPGPLLDVREPLATPRGSSRVLLPPAFRKGLYAGEIGPIQQAGQQPLHAQRDAGAVRQAMAHGRQ